MKKHKHHTRSYHSVEFGDMSIPCLDCGIGGVVPQCSGCIELAKTHIVGNQIRFAIQTLKETHKRIGKKYDGIIIFVAILVVIASMVVSVNFLGQQDPYQLDPGSSKTKPISIR